MWFAVEARATKKVSNQLGRKPQLKTEASKQSIGCKSTKEEFWATFGKDDIHISWNGLVATTTLEEGNLLIPSGKVIGVLALRRGDWVELRDWWAIAEEKRCFYGYVFYKN